ncbi:MAG: hypothetical protein ACTSUM_04095 [Alphaproteobacteria bacterium]
MKNFKKICEKKAQKNTTIKVKGVVTRITVTSGIERFSCTTNALTSSKIDDGEYIVKWDDLFKTYWSLFSADQGKLNVAAATRTKNEKEFCDKEFIDIDITDLLGMKRRLNVFNTKKRTQYTRINLKGHYLMFTDIHRLIVANFKNINFPDNIQITQEKYNELHSLFSDQPKVKIRVMGGLITIKNEFFSTTFKNNDEVYPEFTYVIKEETEPKKLDNLTTIKDIFDEKHLYNDEYSPGIDFTLENGKVKIKKDDEIIEIDNNNNNNNCEHSSYVNPKYIKDFLKGYTKKELKTINVGLGVTNNAQPTKPTIFVQTEKDYVFYHACMGLRRKGL